ncbi:nuclear transport factor 2 family protein [Streptomyces thinghirensis]|uniref:SnoaL-like domain-containing protein n=1 Tax=Streptomyces thinghirensis TaxID=551547 RepID=A0ABP9T7T0_9ACTN
MVDTQDALLTRVRDLESRLQRLEDVESIKDMHRRYIRKLADRDWDGMADFFTEDAVTDIRWHGRTEGKQHLVEHVFNDLHKTVTSADGYILSSPVIEIEPGGDTAYGEWTWHRHICEFRMSGGFMRVWGPWLEGRYRCTYRRVDGQWLFQNMWFRVVLPDVDPEEHEMEARLAGSHRHVIGGPADPRP